MVKYKRIWLWWLMLGCGLLCTVILLAGRICAEADDKQVSAAAYLADVESLADESGLPLERWLSALSEAGVEHLILSPELLASSEHRPELTPFSLAVEGNEPFDGAAFRLPSADSPLAADGVPVALVENFARAAVTEPANFDWDSWDGPLVKTLWMFDDYRCRYTDELGGQEIENLLFRATAERGMRLLILRPFAYENGDPVLDPAVYGEVLDALERRLAVMGISFGEGFSAMEAPAFRPLLSCGAGLLAAALWIALLMKLRLPAGAEWALCLLAIAILGGGFALMPDFSLRATMLLCALIFPLWTAWAIYRLAAGGFTSLRSRPAALVYLIALGAVVLWSTLGGLAVSALMSRRIYLMGGAIFSGVKVSQFLPLVVCFVLLALLAARTMRPLFSKDRILPLAATAVALGVLAWLLALYSGDGNHLPGPENAIRDWMELHVYARPRNKELFFAVPAIGCFILACRRKNPFLILPLGIAACLESASIVNTFCHAVAPLSLSLARTLLAAGMGLPLGLLCMAILWLAMKKKTSSPPEA